MANGTDAPTPATSTESFIVQQARQWLTEAEADAITGQNDAYRLLGAAEVIVARLVAELTGGQR